MSTSPSFVLHLGATGSGKTWRLKDRVATAVRSGFCDSGARFLVADVKREWPRGRKDPPRTPLTNGSKVPMGFLTHRVPRVDAELPAVTIARPREGSTEEEIRAWFDRLVRFALTRTGVVLVAPEVWRYAPEGHPLSDALAELGHEHRHVDCALWMDCQSYPEVSKRLIRRCGYHLLHGTGAFEDLVRLRKMGGPKLEEAVVASMKLNKERGPGHFVVFAVDDPFPPYALHGPGGRELARYG